jgi:hypothetical protein
MLAIISKSTALKRLAALTLCATYSHFPPFTEVKDLKFT